MSFRLLNGTGSQKSFFVKRLLTIFACFVTFKTQALEHKTLLENDQVSVAQVKIAPYEEIGLHRDEYPHVVIPMLGGTITRLEPDGRMTDVNFPTGTAVYRGVDPEGVLHRSVNNSSAPIELLIIQLKGNIPKEPSCARR